MKDREAFANAVVGLMPVYGLRPSLGDALVELTGQFLQDRKQRVIPGGDDEDDPWDSQTNPLVLVVEPVDYNLTAARRKDVRLGRAQRCSREQ